MPKEKKGKKYKGARLKGDYVFEMPGIGKLEKGKIYPQISEESARKSPAFELVYEGDK